MPVLRVLVAAAPSPAQDTPWALYDAQDRLVRSGVGPPASWPDAARREAVLAAAAVRLARVVLPPMPADRVPAAAAFALEDQLAGPAQAQHLVASKRARDGAVEVAIAARSLFPRLRDGFARVVAEPSVAPVPPGGTWRWYASGLAGGFVRRPDGSAFAAGTPERGGAAPPELALALARADAPPPRVEVAFPIEDASLAAWSAQCRTTFARTPAWRWDQDGSALAAAGDLLQGEFSRTPRTAPVSAAGRFRWALGIAAAALALHVAGTLGQWAWLRYETWQTARSIVSTARNAGAGEAADADTAAAALAKRFAAYRHRAGLAAPDDALPLLARAAAALAALPPGALKSATYTAGTWTFDLGKVDPAAAAALDRGLATAGLATLAATTAAGTRMRVSPAPGTGLP
ncbi:MAG: hypothetical protein IT518_15630 [Burkholderiales bacterium]|nr:hypothetical protein [Burkholderiales bacterium]